WLFFFFQAEDGIRVDLVTGVQTCALPISRSSSAACAATAAWPLSGGATFGSDPFVAPWRSALRRRADDPVVADRAGRVGRGGLRSEERRVGKECRARGSA